MKVFLSPSRESFLLEQGATWTHFVADRDPQSATVDSKTREILLGRWHDAEEVDADDFSDARSHLASAIARQQALFLALCLINPDEHAPNREQVIRLLSDVLDQEQTAVQYIERVLAAAEIPQAADFVGAIELSRRHGLSAIGDLYSGVLQLRDEIGRVRRAWDRLPDAEFGGPQKRVNVQAKLVQEGAFLKWSKRANDGHQLRALFKAWRAEFASSDLANPIEAWHQGIQESLREDDAKTPRVLHVDPFLWQGDGDRGGTLRRSGLRARAMSVDTDPFEQGGPQ